ncbi:MAG: hypothetical protein JGK17_00955 [Microcoleus sp. PH2017_10_PVI_O_A]|uniref:hypothetical protein n=1 Tax=unclassified Microcoleus TaxID=2642155 RepID=UPI001D832D5C|nr:MULTISPECIES: hypothetical protein [unclassified Microcoleus]TAE84824.1 MAG: hypothetical protein EAZ83_04380 [Oscillatoriales cyanobacterium]MCC3404188.1 hypothetical protein [Microcoleus sp. PH2017_10_PVI_O_A]MCC3458274.1 hypothetical protein [Microcoleus sp. PH2017_11_PCY_U_A]MCC3476640.1 hypothetical protein [Microcoleus sp. PH2017_12_PCY_D_A]MCC3557679.1 hypothetical protein [Microcoleus sp. PH2017_27_LUM_O_A]
MAKLPDKTITSALNLQRRLLEGIDAAKAAESAIFEQSGETDATATVLDQLQNSAERLREPYSRLYTLLLRIAEAQPASSAMLDLLYRSIEQGQAALDASAASVQEAKRDWNIL